MKIAFLVGQFPALSATFILNQVTGLIDLGHEVEIFAFKDPKEGKIHPDFFRYRLAGRTHYFSIPKNRLLRVLKAFGLLIGHLPRYRARLWPAFNVRRFGQEALNLTLFFCLVPFLDRDFDILHCHFGTMGLYGSFLKDLGVSAKLVTTFYGFDLSSHVREEGEDVYERLFSRGDLFLPICGCFRDKLVKLGCPKDRIAVHPVGIEIWKYPFKSRNDRPEEPVFVLGVGRLCEKKGFALGLQAIKEIGRHFPRVRYLIAGGGPLREELQALARSLQVEGKVEFLGSVDEVELLALYARAHIFLLPSMTAADGDQEGTPTVLLEAQAVGLPIVSSLHSGIPEIVRDGQSAFLVREKDMAGLVERLEYLLSHPGTWPDMGKKGREWIEEHFAIDRLAGRLEKHYLGLMEG